MKIIDFHTHILPGLDHGSKSMDECASQVNLLMANGIREVVCTSHFYGHVHKIDAFLSKREVAAGLLSEYIEKNQLDFKYHLAAEVLAFGGLENLERLSELSIGNSNTLLLELPYGPLPSDVETTVGKLIRKGYQILLAHAERYEVLDIEKLISLGAKVQLNASCLCKLFIKGVYLRWIRDGVCVALGSDIHGANEKAVKKLVKATQRLKKYEEGFLSYSGKLLK